MRFNNYNYIMCKNNPACVVPVLVQLIHNERKKNSKPNIIDHSQVKKGILLSFFQITKGQMRGYFPYKIDHQKR